MVSNATLSGLAVAVVLTAGAIYSAKRFAPDEGAAARPRLLRQDIDTFESFEFRRGTLDIVCSRRQEDGQWAIERPLVARADGEFIRHFLDHVSTAAILEHLKPSTLRRRGLSSADLGLEASSPRLVLTRADGSSAEMTFGTHVVDGRLYVEMPDIPGRTILAVDKALFDKLPNAEVSSFRDRRILPFSEERLRQVEFRTGTRAVSLERDATSWTLRQPIEAPASNAEVESLVRYLFSLRVDFDPGSSSAAEIEAESSARHCTPEDATATARFWFSTTDPSASPRFGQLLFGDQVGNRVYLFSPEEKFLATVDASVLDALAVDPEKLRDHRLFPGLAPEDVERLRIASPGESTLVFARGAADGTWSLDQPVTLPARSDAVENFARNILELRDCGFPSDTNAFSEASAVQIVFEFHDGGAVTTSVAQVASPSPPDIEPQDEEPPSPESSVPTPRGTVWTLPSGAKRLVCPDALAVPPDDTVAIHGLLDPVVPFPVPSDGSQLRLQIGTKQPRPLSENDTAIILPFLSPLTALRIESIAPLSVEPYGLLEPVATLTIAAQADTANAAPSALLLGGTAPDGARYAMLRGGYTVYAIAPTTVRSILDK